jgi:DNA polymerase-3 subunit epsilon
MADQPGLWEQNDLLGLLNPRPPAIASEPAGPQSTAAATGLDDADSAAELAGADRTSVPEAVSAAEPVEPSVPSASPRPAPVPQASPLPQPIALPSLAPIQRRPASAAPERILILDTETTGLSPQQGVCIEVGVVLFDVASRAVLQQLSFLLPCQANPAEAINGIAAAVTRLPQPTEAALALFAALVEAADAVVAHHAAFDRQWFGHGALPTLELPWICTMEDIRWPAEMQLRPNPSLRDLALAHGVPVWAAHRALTDCDYLVHVFQRCAQLEALLVAAQEPRELYRARLSYAERHQAREAGFRWNDPVTGAWSRRLSRREVDALPFPVLLVERDALPADLRESA